MSAVTRRTFLGTGLAGVVAGGADPLLAQDAKSGAVATPDGWSLLLVLDAAAHTAPAPHQVRARITPPAEDFLGVSMRSVPPREARGDLRNINPWYDDDHPFPKPSRVDAKLIVPVRLDRPIRAGDRVVVTVDGASPTGAASVEFIAENRSALLPCRFVQDSFNRDEPETLVAEIDCLTGCRIPDVELVHVSQLPRRFDPAHPRFPNIAYVEALRCVMVGAGAADLTPRVLYGVDFRADATGGYCAQANAPDVTIRDCLFDDANRYCVRSSDVVNTRYVVAFNEMRGALERTRGDFSTLPFATRDHAAFFMRHYECESDVRLNRIHGSTNDGVIIIRGTCARNAIYSQGWDNRPQPGHADAIWCATMTPGTPKLLVEGNFVDSRDPGHGFYSITGSLGIALPPTQSHDKIPTGDAFHDGLVVRRNLMLSHRISWNMVDGIAGPHVPNDRRYVRRHHIHDNWFTAPFRDPPTTPLYPWTHPNMRWSPDARWINNVDPTTGDVWVMGPQPKDMLFEIVAATGAVAPGGVAQFVLKIDRYLAQYGPVTLRLAEHGGGFERPLDADVETAIRGYDGVEYRDGRFTFRQGLVGREVGQGAEGVSLRIARRLTATASGRVALEIADASVGQILASMARIEIV